MPRGGVDTLDCAKLLYNHPQRGGLEYNPCPHGTSIEEEMDVLTMSSGVGIIVDVLKLPRVIPVWDQS